MIKKLFLNDKFILGLILLNSVILFINSYFLSESDQQILAIIDNSITALFMLELIFKCKEFGFQGYFGSNWNKLDFVLILLSIPALITFIFNLNIIDFSFLLVFRIMRVFKAFRFFKFIPNVGELVAGVQRAMKASVFVFLGFVIYIFIIGVLSFYLFQNSGSEYFKNPLVALYSTFKIFTVEGWFEIPEQIIKNYSETAIFFTYLYFIFVVLTGGIFGLSIVNSIFVDSMVSDNNDELERKIDDLDSKITEILTKINTNET
ncbi:voltage-gated sodium channel [Draconibacterium orientale]|uniref:Ion transporter n=1 Tax=Draconibacterium orientale TaxID=1168034 RepID=X5D978_9BACT|nr:ion transporter [Draconibacterium orientale]AHW59303.1 ion transporter [Draconibacterium orientale]SET84537.1 voltage-gated sodium channel [Draconibacterium orientale]